MSRFSNFVLYSGIATLIYAALFFGVLPTPGLSEQVKDDILPVVSQDTTDYL